MDQIKITFPDGSVKEYGKGISPYELTIKPAIMA